jgi:hypothetical protein
MDYLVQVGLLALHQTAQTLGMEISYHKMKSSLCLEPIQSQIVLDNVILEQMNKIHNWVVKFYTFIKEQHQKITKCVQIPN